jgi:hypothetical protein
MSPRSTLREKRRLVLFSSLCLFWWCTRFLVRLPLHPPGAKAAKVDSSGGGVFEELAGRWECILRDGPAGNFSLPGCTSAIRWYIPVRNSQNRDLWTSFCRYVRPKRIPEKRVTQNLAESVYALPYCRVMVFVVVSALGGIYLKSQQGWRWAPSKAKKSQLYTGNKARGPSWLCSAVAPTPGATA